MIRIGKHPEDMPVEEVKAYFDHANTSYPNAVGVVDIYLDGEYVDLRYEIKQRDGVPFQRIRRITGYLVGDLSRFNNAKRAEVGDRVKHFIE
jgi:hypothetical protein